MIIRLPSGINNAEKPQVSNPEWKKQAQNHSPRKVAHRAHPSRLLDPHSTENTIFDKLCLYSQDEYLMFFPPYYLSAHSKFEQLRKKTKQWLGDNKTPEQVRASVSVNQEQLHVSSRPRAGGPGLRAEGQFTFVRLSCESYGSKLIQEVSSRVREQRTVKQRVFPSERVWIQVSIPGWH